MRRLLFSIALFAGTIFCTPLFARDLSQPYVPDQVLVRFVPGAAASERAAVREAVIRAGW